MDDLLLSLLADCTEREGATDDEMGYIMARMPPETRGHKCLAACMGESIGLMRDSKPDMKTVAKMARQAFGPDSPKIEIAKQMTATCAATVTSDDRCEAASQMYICSTEEAKKHGYEFSDFM